MGISILQQIDEFRSSPSMLDFVSQIGIIKKVAEGDAIFEYSSIKYIPIVLEGYLRVIHTDIEGHELLLYYMKSGEICMTSFLSNLQLDPCKLKAIAEENSEVLLIPILQLETLNRQFPEWTRFVFRLYFTRFEELLDVINALAFKKMDERLWDLLCKKSRIADNRILNITHEQLANELGTVRVVISRLLKQLENQEKIKLGRNRISLSSEVTY